MAAIDDTITSACKAVNGVQRAALVLLPEGLVMGGAGSGDSWELEPLARSVARLARQGGSERAGRGSKFNEYAFVSKDELVLIRYSQRADRPTLAAVTARALAVA